MSLLAFSILFFGLHTVAQLVCNSSLTFPTLALTRYVSTSGNNANDGKTSATAWRTISKAASTVSAGTTVYVRAGTYNEAVTITVSGTNSSTGWINFCNYPGETPIVDGTGLTVPTSDTGLFYILNKNFIIIQGFEIRNYKTTNSNALPAGIRIGGTSTYITVFNNIIHDIQNTGSASGSINAHAICVYGTSGTSAITNIIVDTNQIYNCKLGNSETVTFNGNVNGFQFTNNVVHNNDNIGVDVIGGERTAPSNDQARNGKISGNVISYISSGSNPAYTDLSADGIYVDGGANVVISNNIVFSSDIGIEVASEHSGHYANNCTVRNNLVYSNNVVGLSLGGYATNVGYTQNCSFLNNTLWHNDVTSSGTGELNIQYNPVNNILKFNTFVTSTQAYFFSNGFTSGTGNVIDYNSYKTPVADGDETWQWQNNYYYTWSSYRTSTLLDAHSTFVASTNPALCAVCNCNSSGVPTIPSVFGCPLS